MLLKMIKKTFFLHEKHEVLSRETLFHRIGPRVSPTLLVRLLTLVVGGLVMLLLMRVVICLGFVVAGTLLFWTFIGFFHCHF